MSLMHDVLAVHEDPEALFLYGTCQAHAGDEGALASLTQALGTGYRVPAALRSNAWLSGLRRDGRLDALVERAEGGRGEASRAFRANGGEELLGEL